MKKFLFLSMLLVLCLVSSCKNNDAVDNYVGYWAEQISERVVMNITRDNNKYKINITWREELPQKDEWNMTGLLKEDGKLYYDDCRFIIKYIDEDREEEQYINGSGIIEFNENDMTLSWTDQMIENQDENVMVFKKANFS